MEGPPEAGVISFKKKKSGRRSLVKTGRGAGSIKDRRGRE